MYIATVIPLARGIQKEHLTYFTAKEIPLGSIVSVPVRSKMIDAIVIELDDVTNLKGGVKNADFQLKKIEKVKGVAPYKSTFFKACEIMASYNAGTVGSVIDSMLPNILLDRYEEIIKINPPEPTPFKKDIKTEKVIFQASLEDRISWYRTLIREAFAKKQSVFICVPTQYDIERFYEAFSKGIKEYVFQFYSDLPKKNIINDFNRSVSVEHPILIIGTGSFMCIPRYDIGTIIVEHESSGAYKQMKRPYVDVRNFAEILADLSRTKLIYGDTLLRPETLHRHEENELGEVASPHFRLPQVERQLIIDMKEELDKKGQHSFKVLSETVKNMITYALDHKENVFLFTVRKGLAGITVCNDCGHTLLCNHCHTPVVLYGSKQRSSTKNAEDRIFMCNKCGRKDTTQTSCPKCGSWNLNPLGIGTDRVVEELNEIFPKSKVVQIDKETTSTEKEMKKAYAEFLKEEGSILVGTEMAFSCIKDKVTHSAIISLDGLLSIPSFNINQKILHLIERLSSVTKRNMLIQTRLSENNVLKYVLSGNVLPLYREDLKEREEFGYPPFNRLIKITFRGNSKDTEKAKSYLEEIFEEYEPQIFSAFTSIVRGEYVTNTVLKVSPTIWTFPPKDTGGEQFIKLKEKLLSLPPSFLVNIDPEDLL